MDKIWNVEYIQKKYIQLIDSFNIEKINILSKQNAENELDEMRMMIIQFWNEYGKDLIDSLSELDLMTTAIWSDMEADKVLPKLLLFFDIVLIPDSFPEYTDRWAEVDFNYKYTTLSDLIDICSKAKDVNNHLSRTVVIIYPQFSSLIISEHDRLNIKKRSEELATLMLSEYLGFVEKIDTYDHIFEYIKSEKSLAHINKRLNSIKVNKLTCYWESRIAHTHQTKKYVVNEQKIRAISNRVRKHQINRDDITMMTVLLNADYTLYQMRMLDSQKVNFTYSNSEKMNIFTKLNDEVLSHFLIENNNQLGQKTIISSFESKFEWLDTLELSDIKLVRSDENIELIRTTFANTLSNLATSNINSSDLANELFEKEIVHILNEYNQLVCSKIKDYKYKKYGNIANFAFNAGIGISSFSNPYISIVSLLLNCTLGGKSLLDLAKNQKEINQCIEHDKISALRILYKYYSK